MQKVKKKIKKLTNNVNDEIKLHKYGAAIKQIVSIYEYALKELYKRYLGELKNPIEVIEYMNSNKVSMFGTWLGFLSKTQFLDEIYMILKNDKFTEKQSFIKHLNAINTIRISETHIGSSESFDDNDVSKELAKEAENTMMKFLKWFELYNMEHISSAKFASVNLQKLIGEIQLYESLYETLYDEDISHVDVTYFSGKIPKPSEDSIVSGYWSLISKKINEKKLSLRRIVTIDEFDKKGNKLLWILFNMIPKLYKSLNDNVKVSLFKTSGSFINSAEYVPTEVNLLNMILMYNKKDPDKGHIWIFSGHQNSSQEQEYIHIYGSENVVVFQKLYNNLFASSMELNDTTIKSLLNSRGTSLNNDNIEEFIIKVMSIRETLQIKEEEIDEIINIYKTILTEKEKDDDGIW